MTRPFYDVDDVPFRRAYTTKSGWGLLAPQIFGSNFYEPPRQAERPVCAETDPDLFFPEKGNGWLAQRAMRICATCPLKAECLDAALHRHEQFGVWGGTTPRQRRRIAQQRGIPMPMELAS